MAQLLDLLTVAPAGPGRWTGECLEGSHGRIFGGQVLAQAMSAAAAACGTDRPLHAVHASFLRPGDPATPVTYTVTPLKTGRALTVLRADAGQADRMLLTATVSFHDPEDSPDLQLPPPAVPAPDTLARSDYAPPGTNADVRRVFDIRYTDDAPLLDTPAEPQQAVWFRADSPLPAAGAVHACALAYAIDLTLTRTAHMPLKRYPANRIGASLDHSMWFHRPARADDWLLFAQRSTTYAASRALSHAHLFDTAGRLVASAAQEALIRMRG